MTDQTPDTAQVIETYDALKDAVSAFVNGKFSLVVVLGTPGLSKSQTLKAAMGDRKQLLIKGARSAIKFYCSLYHLKDEPVILDDADSFFAQRHCRSYIKSLTETDSWKRLDYDTATKILDEEGVPRHFHTKSSVCIISNWWSRKDPICEAIASRAHFFVFRPDWGEVYKEAANWFWDQEIFDYLYDRLDVLKRPDCRILTKASEVKEAGLSYMPWEGVIDAHVDDPNGRLIRRLLNDNSYRSNDARAQAFVEMSGACRATFYNRLREIRADATHKHVRRLRLKRQSKPIEERPADGVVEGAEEECVEPEDGQLTIRGVRQLDRTPNCDSA